MNVIFNRELEICWSDSRSEKNLQEVFSTELDFTNLFRWVLSDKTPELLVSLKHKEQKKVIKARLFRLKDNFLLSESDPLDTVSLEDAFWRVFSKTFPGAFLFLSSELEVLEASHLLLSILDVKNRDGIALSKKAILGRAFEYLFANDPNHPICKKIKRDIAESKQSRLVKSSEIEHAGRHLSIVTTSLYEREAFKGSCIYVFDISTEVESQILIKEQESMLFHSAKLASLGEMAGGIAHEINNPLAILQGNVDLSLKAMSKGKLTEEKLTESLRKMSRTIERIAKIVNGMRTLSRDSESDEKATCTCGELVKDVLGVSKESCMNKGITFIVDTPEEITIVPIHCARIQISQVLINLLNNAVDALDGIDSPEIVLQVKEKEEKIQFLVKDNGPGISQEVHEKIFQPFFTTKEIGKGTGLGLSLSSKIVQEHDSELVLERVGEQTIFSFDIEKDLKNEQ